MARLRRLREARLLLTQHSVSVAGAVVDAHGRALAIRRADNGHWEPPGGILELEEDLASGVRREVLEETGVHVHVDRLTGVYKNMKRGIVALVFRCTPVAGAPRPSDESTEVAWLTASEIEDRMLPAYACRILDALTEVPGTPAIRAHDGHELLD